MPPRQLAGDPHHFHGDDAQSLVLEPGQNATHEPPLHTIRLEQDQRAFHEEAANDREPTRTPSPGRAPPAARHRVARYFFSGCAS
jgi:hypothetical protein